MTGRRLPTLLVLLAIGGTLALTLTGCLSAAERRLDDVGFRSVSGTDGSGVLGWIDQQPVRWSATTLDGEYTAVILPPCAAINAPVVITDDDIVVDMSRAAIAAVACEEPTASRDAWVHSFFSAPVSYTWDGTTLIMTSDARTLTFERIPERARG